MTVWSMHDPTQRGGSGVRSTEVCDRAVCAGTEHAACHPFDRKPIPARRKHELTCRTSQPIMALTTEPPPPEPDPESLPTDPTPPTPAGPTRAEVFSAVTSAPPHPSPSDPRVSLRPPAPHLYTDNPQTLSAFRDSEGPARRQSRLRSLFDSIPAPSPPSSPAASTSTLPDEHDEEEKREELRKLYARELWKKCAGAVPHAMTDEAKAVRWTAFEKYAEEKERELWKVFVELDVDGDMRLKKAEVREACKRAGVEVKEATLGEFVRAVDRNGDGEISFDEWRDFLLVSLPSPRSVTVPGWRR